MLDTFYFETLSINSLFYILDIYTSASHLYCIMPLFVLDFFFFFWVGKIFICINPVQWMPKSFIKIYGYVRRLTKGIERLSATTFLVIC